MLEGEKVSFDAYVGFMVWLVSVKVNLTYFDYVIPTMAMYVKYEKGYVMLI